MKTIFGPKFLAKIYGSHAWLSDDSLLLPQDMRALGERFRQLLKIREARDSRGWGETRRNGLAFNREIRVITIGNQNSSRRGG